MGWFLLGQLRLGWYLLGQLKLGLFLLGQLKLGWFLLGQASFLSKSWSNKLSVEEVLVLKALVAQYSKWDITRVHYGLLCCRQGWVEISYWQILVAVLVISTV